MERLIAKRILLLIPLAIILYIIWWNLPVSINRFSEIKLGDKVIRNIENYRKENGRLPETGDWKTLKTLGFEDKIDFLIPDYQKLNETDYELTYVEGFDGPYLLWNTREKEWKMDMPTFPDDWYNK